jgi:hypothetical protein
LLENKGRPLKKNESDDIISNKINAISDEEFQKEVKEYYEYSKRRKKRRLSS